MRKISTLIGFCPFCKRKVKESECSETKRGFVHNCTKTDNKIISTRIDHYNTLRNLKLLAQSRINDIDTSLRNIPQDYGRSFGDLQFAMLSVSENVKNIKNDLKKLENIVKEMDSTNKTRPRDYLHGSIPEPTPTLRNLKLLAQTRLNHINDSINGLPQDIGHSDVSDKIKSIKIDLKQFGNYIEEMNKTNETLPLEYLNTDITQQEIRIVRILRKFMGKEYSNRYTVLQGPQDEDFCEKCKKVFNENEYNIYSDISECCYCLDCFFGGIWKYFKLSRKDRHLIKALSKRRKIA